MRGACTPKSTRLTQLLAQTQAGWGEMRWPGEGRAHVYVALYSCWLLGDVLGQRNIPGSCNDRRRSFFSGSSETPSMPSLSQDGAALTALIVCAGWRRLLSAMRARSAVGWTT
jgi:hypothetical protein